MPDDGQWQPVTGLHPLSSLSARCARATAAPITSYPKGLPIVVLQMAFSSSRATPYLARFLQRHAMRYFILNIIQWLSHLPFITVNYAIAQTAARVSTKAKLVNYAFAVCPARIEQTAILGNSGKLPPKFMEYISKSSYMKWNAQLYDDRHTFVAQYGKDLLAHLSHSSIISVLDLGCGTGTLSGEIATMGKRVVGIDSSPEMIDQARALYPSLEFMVMNACELPWTGEFDAVFSNAVFHWITEQDSLLAAIYSALKAKGWLVCEFGGRGNIESIEKAFSAAMQRRGGNYHSPFFFPTPGEYGARLGAAGFNVVNIASFARPTPLAGAESGLKNWITQFFAAHLRSLPAKAAADLLEEIADELRPQLWDGRQWVADYIRLRVLASKN